MASRAYCDPKTLMASGYGFVDNDHYELQAVYGADTVAFRGTSNLENWLLNLDTIKTDYKDAKVHKGFYTAWLSLKPSIMN